MSITAAQLLVIIQVQDADKAKSALQGVGQAVDETSSKVSTGLLGTMKNAAMGFLDFGNKLGGTITAIKSIASGAMSFGESLLKPAADLEQIQGSLEIFTGSAAAARQEMANLASFASHTPFETGAIEQAALKLQSVGISSQDVIPDLLSLGDALDAVGRTSSADLSQVASNFVKIQTQGHLSTEVMQSFADMGIDAWGVLEKQTGKTHASLQAMITKGLYPAKQAMDDLTKGIEANPLFKGQMANDANVFNGIVSTLKSNWQQLMAIFGSPIIKDFEPQLGKLADAFSSPAFQQFAAVMGQKVADALAKVEFGIAFIASALRSMAAYARIALEPFNDEPFGIFLASLKDVVVAAGRVIDALARIGVTLLQGLLPPLNLSARTFSSFFATVLYGLGDFLAKIAVQLNSFAALLLNSTNMTGKITAIRTMLADLFSWLGSHASSILTLFAPPIIKIIALLLRLSDVLHIDIKSALSSLERYIASSVLPLLLRLSNALDIDTTHGIVAFARSIQEKLVFALQYAYMSLLILGDWIRYGFTKALEAVAPLILAVGNAVQHALGGDSFKSANEALRTLAQDGLTLVLIGLDWLKYGAQQVSDWFDRRIKPAINGALPSFERLGDVLLHVVGPAIGRMALDKLDLFGFILGKVGSVIGRFLGFAIQLGSVLAEGLATGLKIVMPLVETLSTVFDNLVSSGVDEWAKGLIHVMDQLSPSLDHLRSRFAQIGAMSDGQAGLNKLQKVINDFFVWLNKSVKPAIDQAMPSFQKLGDVLLNTVAPALGRIAWDKLDSAGKILEKLAPVIADAVPFLIKLAGVLSDGLARALKFATPLFEEASKALSKFLLEIIERLGPKAREEIASLTKGIDAWGKIWAVIAPGVKRGLDDIVRNIKLTFHIIEGLILAALDIWTGDWGRLWEDIKQTVINIYNDLVGHSIIPEMLNKITELFVGLPARVMAPVTSLYNQITAKFTDLASKGTTWMTDFGNNIVNGLNAVIGRVQSSAARVAGGIELNLHHSVPKAGPLADELEWMPHLGDNLVHGLNAQIGKVRAAALNIATQMSVIGSYPSLGGDINVTPASVTNTYRPQIIVQPTPVHLDGRQLMNGLMPYFVDRVTGGTGAKL